MKEAEEPAGMNKGRSFYTITTLILAILGMIVIISVQRNFVSPVQVRQVNLNTRTGIAAPTATPGRLERPRLSDPPTQVEQGGLIFWGICMACHGDRGQGLTDEWRTLAYADDKDCWSSQCHGSSHPSQGFELPRSIPALVGESRLGKFMSARQLYDYVLAAMPWWNPGSLTPEQGWQVTTYLLKLNGSLPSGIFLDGIVASAIPIHRKLSLPQNDTLFALVFAGVLGLIVIGMVLNDTLAKNAEPAPLRRNMRRPSFISHLHPPAIPAAQARWRYTLGAGGIAVFLCFVLVVTGLLEMFYYIPTPTQAPATIETIHFFVPLGSLVRNLHYWSAQLLIVVSAIHLLRVVFTGAYSAHRRFNFVLGIILFTFLIILDFTGYVLRWDEGIRWALITGTNLVGTIPLVGPTIYQFVTGGIRVGPATLLRFYAWHIFALSAAAAFLLVWHIFRVRRDGGISAPVTGSTRSKNPIASLPGDTPESRHISARVPRSELIRREILGIIIVSVFLILLSTFAPAPLAAPIQDSLSLSTYTRAPWFFLWVQQLLKLGDPFLLGVMIPVLVLALITAFPYILPGAAGDEMGQWFPYGGRTAQFLITVLAIIILALTLLALLPSSNV